MCRTVGQVLPTSRPARGWTRLIVARGTEPLPTALNSAADTSAGSGRISDGSSVVRGPAGTLTVLTDPGARM